MTGGLLQGLQRADPGVGTHPKVICPRLTYPSVCCLVGAFVWALGAITLVARFLVLKSNRRDTLWTESSLESCLEATITAFLGSEGFERQFTKEERVAECNSGHWSLEWIVLVTGRRYERALTSTR
jgi:hypothetical protein